VFVFTLTFAVGATFTNELPQGLETHGTHHVPHGPQEGVHGMLELLEDMLLEDELAGGGLLSSLSCGPLQPGS